MSMIALTKHKCQIHESNGVITWGNQNTIIKLLSVQNTRVYMNKFSQYHDTHLWKSNGTFFNTNYLSFIFCSLF